MRGTMEARFGHDFSKVRVHTDRAAADSARALHAQAYTIGRDIVFGAGEYQPRGERGLGLLAHELAHVTQQARGGSIAGAEQRAGQAAAKAVAGEAVSSGDLGGAPVGIQRQPLGGEAKEGDAAPQVLTHRQWSTVLGKFTLNGAAIGAGHKAEIDKLAWSIGLHLGMLANGKSTISIIGHTDRSGSEQHNQGLGQERADAVKAALLAALAQEKVDTARIGDIQTVSLGENVPAIPTPDGVQKPENRRVEINVAIGSVVPAPPKPKTTIVPPIIPPQEDKPGPGPRREGDDWWKRAEENQRKIEEFDRKHPRESKSLAEAVIDKVMEGAVDPLLKKLPVSKDLRDLARSGIRKGLESGSEKACEAAIDGAGAQGAEAEALKSVCKAALKTKPVQ